VGAASAANELEFAAEAAPTSCWLDHYLKGPGGEPPPYEIDNASRLAEYSESPRWQTRHA
jgi:hypothetical protein